jgi:hypothetical protein
MALRIIALLLSVPVVIVGLEFGAYQYASGKYRGLTPGMTRAEVNRHLWAFASYQNTRYQGAGSGRIVIRYELLWFGKSGSIQVVYNADGTVLNPQPIFDN